MVPGLKQIWPSVMIAKRYGLSNYRQPGLLKYFAAGMPAGSAADLIDIYRNSVICFFGRSCRTLLLNEAINCAARSYGENKSCQKLFLAMYEKVKEAEVPSEKRLLPVCYIRRKMYTVFLSRRCRKAVYAFSQSQGAALYPQLWLCRLSQRPLIFISGLAGSYLQLPSS